MKSDDPTSVPELMSLEQLLAWIESGGLALPDFQRKFVWREHDVVQLLATVLRGWPAGSLLFLEKAPTFIGQPRSFEPGPPVVRDLVRYVVLDGQQRLTALYHALSGAGDMRYYLEVPRGDLGSLLDVESLEGHIKAAKVGTAPRIAADCDVIPFTDLRTPAAYFAWLDDFIAADSSEVRSALRERFTRVYRLLAAELIEYQFPVVVLRSSVEPDAVARMFERVNRTGWRLNAFDLVVARTYSEDWNLRREFDAAISDYPLLEPFLEEDGLPILQSLALRRDPPNVRRQAVISLTADVVRADWRTSVTAMASVIDFLSDRCGLLNAAWLPYGAMLVVMTAFVVEHDIRGHEALLERWFWSRGFGGAFEVGVNTAIVSEFSSLKAAAHGDVLPPRAIDREAIRRSAKRADGQLFRTFLCAMAATGAYDLARAGLDQRPLQFGEAVAYSLLPRDDDDPPAHLRTLSQIEASGRPTWLRGPNARRSVAGRLSELGAPVPQLLPAVALLRRPDLASDDFWEARLALLEDFLLEHAGQGFGA
jgi:hypothetical protein